MIKSIQTRLYDIPVKMKIVLLYLLAVVLPILILLLIFIAQIRTEFSRREEALVRGELTRFQVTINSMVETTKQLASIYFTNKELTWALETYSEGNKESLTVIRDIDNQVVSHTAVHPFVQDMMIYHHNSHIFETKHSHYIDEKVSRQMWYKDYSTQSDMFFLAYNNDDLNPGVYLVRKLNAVNYDSENLIKIDISTQWITQIFQSNLLDSSEQLMYLVDPNGKIVASNQENYNNRYDVINSNKDYIIYQQPFDANSLLANWQVVIMYEKRILLKDISKQTLMIIGIFIFVFIASLLLFYGLAHSIILRLEQIAKVMDQSENDKLISIDTIMGKDEIGITANSYNKMVQRIRELIYTNNKTNQDLKDSNEALLNSLKKVENQGQQIYELVYHDKLTGLHNRYGILSYLDNYINEIDGNELFAVGFLDIDNFKIINDTYGHDTGDEILKQFGVKLKQFEGQDIHIGRFGGDEFIVAIQHYDNYEKLKVILEKIRLVLKEPIEINKITYTLTISMGVSIYGIHAQSGHELITLADIALYKAKEHGRDQIILFENAMHQFLLKKTHQQELLRKAIREQQFVLFYQPYYSSFSQEIKGCEALIRWKKECRLDMSPQEVIQHIEEMGLMIDFGKWIMKEACLFAKRLNTNRKTLLRVAINISALQLMSQNFVKDVFDILTTNSIDSAYISLEMTESILMDSLENGSKILFQLQEGGIHISLDDFGTGYSSLRYFKELPISTLKIDKSFIDHICTSQYEAHLVETIIRLAHNKKVDVIAEGIETQDQFDLLRSMSCDNIQGYLFAKPMGEELLVEMLRIKEV